MSFSHPPDVLTLLLKDCEWIVHTLQVSDREGPCDSHLVCLRKHALSILEVKKTFRRRKHLDPEQTHAGRLVVTVSDR